MTNNIAKLYELANAFTTYTVQGGDTYKVTRFTPEKQLELIKWVQLLDNIDNLQMFHHELNNRWCFIVEMLPEFSSIPTERLHCSHEQFEQALSSLVIQLWNDLTDKQKEEIKEILK